MYQPETQTETGIKWSEAKNQMKTIARKDDYIIWHVFPALTYLRINE